MDSDYVDYVKVKCECCKKIHRVAKGELYTCPKSFDKYSGSKSGWYILVYLNGEIEQTMNFENLQQKVEILQREETEVLKRKLN